MKSLIILLILGLLEHVHALQLPSATASITDIAYSLKKGGLEQNSETHFNPSFNQLPGWYVSTNPATIQTSILFLDTDQRVIYEEKLSGHYVELTAHNRRILDQMLTRLTSHQLVMGRLKTKPFPLAWQGLPGNSSEEIPASLPADNSTPSPTGIMSRVLIMNKELLFIWLKALAPEKTTLLIRDSMGEILKLRTVKVEQYTDAFSLLHLNKGSYFVSLYGKTWRKEYVVNILLNQGHRHVELLPR